MQKSFFCDNNKPCRIFNVGVFEETFITLGRRSLKVYIIFLPSDRFREIKYLMISKRKACLYPVLE